MRGMWLYCRSQVKLLQIVSSKPMKMYTLVLVHGYHSPYPLPGPLKCPRGTDL